MICKSLDFWLITVVKSYNFSFFPQKRINEKDADHLQWSFILKANSNQSSVSCHVNKVIEKIN